MIDYHNPAVIKAMIRFVIAGLLVLGVQLPDGTEESAFGIYLAFETVLTLSAAKKQTAVERKVDGRV